MQRKRTGNARNTQRRLCQLPVAFLLTRSDVRTIRRRPPPIIDTCPSPEIGNANNEGWEWKNQIGDLRGELFHLKKSDAVSLKIKKTRRRESAASREVMRLSAAWVNV